MAYCENCEHCKNTEKKPRKPRTSKYPIVDGEKECSTCNLKKPINLFNKRSNGLLKSHCKSCQKIINSKYYKTTKDNAN